MGVPLTPAGRQLGETEPGARRGNLECEIDVEGGVATSVTPPKL